MAGKTPVYGLTFFDFRDSLDSAVNVRKEIERFLLIDKQLFGLYSIFGNGVIDGWTISDGSASGGPPLSVGVNAGIGIINLIATETTSPEIILDLPTNDTVDIYAIITGGTINDRDVDFIWSRTSPGSGSVRLGRVSTVGDEIQNIDSDFRDEIGFIEIIKEEIAKHKHRGTPSKIDLQQETKNQLPGARLEDFDASKIVSGTLDPERIPILDHNDLDNNGLLTHAALDSFVRTLTSGNRELLGEVQAVNLLKTMTSLKHIDSNIEDGYVNSLIISPGITNNDLIDFDTSNAHIDLDTNCISGVPTSVGQVRSVIWETTSAFLTASDRNLVAIARDEVSLSRGGIRTTFVENFEQVPSDNAPIPTFNASTNVISENVKVLSTSDQTFRTQGFFGGEFTTGQETRAIYVKDINSNNDWSDFDELVVDVKSLSETHGSVKMNVTNVSENGTEFTSQDFLLLGEDEVTTNLDPDLNGFERRTFSIKNITRNNVTKLTIFTDDNITKHTFYLDNIFLRNQAQFPPEGSITFRYSSGTSVLFNSINFEADEGANTDIQIRARVANSSQLLDRSVFTPILKSGDVFALEGTDIEISVRLLSNEERDATPVLDSIQLQIIVDSEEVGFNINDSEEWDRGTFSNMQRNFDSSVFSSALSIEDPVPVGDRYFSFKNVVSQNDPNNIAIFGFQAPAFMLSPKQAINFVENQGAKGFDSPFSVYRLENTNFLIADLENDRVVEFTPQGKFVKGIGSHNVVNNDFFFPLTAVYNPVSGIITTAFSQEISIDEISIEKITIWLGGSPIALGPNDQILASNINNRLLSIELSADKVAQLRGINNNVTIQFNPGTFTVNFGFTESAQQLLGLQGLKVFIGDFNFVSGINRPVFANQASSGNWIVGNSSIFFDSDQGGSDVAIFSVNVDERQQFTVEVPPPEEGFYVQWDISIPGEVTSFININTPPPGNRAQINVNNPTEDVVGEHILDFTAQYKNVDTNDVVSTTQSQAKLVINSSSNNQSGDSEEFSVNVPSIIEYDLSDLSVAFSYNKISFSDFTLGSVFEINNNQLLIAGIVKIQDALVEQGSPSSGEETFAEEAFRKLDGYRGKVFIIQKNSGAISFDYDTPDGSYASDAVLDKDGNVVVAETSFVSNTGRIVKLNSFGNIIFQIGGGVFSKINDVRALNDGKVIIST